VEILPELLEGLGGMWSPQPLSALGLRTPGLASSPSQAAVFGAR